MPSAKSLAGPSLMAPAGDATDQAPEEVQARRVIGHASRPAWPGGPAVGVHVDPGPVRDGKAFGARPAGEDAIADLVGLARSRRSAGTCRGRGRRPGRRPDGPGPACPRRSPRTGPRPRGDSNLAALWRATASAVACSSPTGSSHIRSAREYFLAALILAAGQPDGRGDFLGPRKLSPAGDVGGPGRGNRGDFGEELPAFGRREDPCLGLDRAELASSRQPSANIMAWPHRALVFPESNLSRNLDRLYPPVPPIVREPVYLNQVMIRSRFFLAPLAGYTSLAFRLAVRGCGGLGLATTDLVNARSLLEQRRRALELAETCDEDRPLAIQLYGHINQEMEAAARWVEGHGATVVDINMGCPVRKVVRSGGGSALLCQVDRAVELVGAVVRSVTIPGDGEDAAGLGRRVADGAGAGPRVRAGRRRRR